MKGEGVVVGILGPTGVGKTGVGVALAHIMGTRVISCDSMQVYRGFPVLTNQPSAQELEAAPHELVSFADPLEVFSAAQYAEVARGLIEEDLRRQGTALVVGGTGLYMRAALAPLDVGAEADSGLRAELEARAANGGAGALHAELARVDPSAAQRIDPRNVRRVIRALESVAVSGRSWSGREDLWAPAYDHPTLIVGLVLDRTELYERIERRAAVMARNGAVAEVRSFRAENRGSDTEPGGAGVRSAIGYPEICRYLDCRQSLEQTVEQLAAATRRYARRQLTWLRKVEGAVIIDVQGRDPREIAQQIADLAKSGAHTIWGA